MQISCESATAVSRLIDDMGNLGNSEIDERLARLAGELKTSNRDLADRISQAGYVFQEKSDYNRRTLRVLLESIEKELEG
ncbi:MAG: hypothetical protein WCW17_03025 [Patescibacteria group bacterium]